MFLVTFCCYDISLWKIVFIPFYGEILQILKNLGDSGAFLHEMVGALRMVGAGLHLLRPTLLLLLHDTLVLRLGPALLLLKCFFHFDDYRYLR